MKNSKKPKNRANPTFIHPPPPLTRQASNSKTTTNQSNKTPSQAKAQIPSPTTKTRSQPPPLIRSSTPENPTDCNSESSQFFYENLPRQTQTNPPITLSTPQSQQMNQPSRSESELLDMETGHQDPSPLSDNFATINLSGILNKTLDTPGPSTSMYIARYMIVYKIISPVAIYFSVVMR